MKLFQNTNTIISVKANDGVIWNIPQYEGTTYEVTDINGDKAIFVID